MSLGGSGSGSGGSGFSPLLGQLFGQSGQGLGSQTGMGQASLGTPNMMGALGMGMPSLTGMGGFGMGGWGGLPGGPTGTQMPGMGSYSNPWSTFQPFTPGMGMGAAQPIPTPNWGGGGSGAAAPPPGAAAPAAPQQWSQTPTSSWTGNIQWPKEPMPSGGMSSW